MGNDESRFRLKMQYHQWKERLNVLLSFVLPNRIFKYFPPELNIKDPILSNIHRQLKNDGQQCAIILFCLDQYPHMVSSYPPVWIETIQRCIRNEIKRFLTVEMKDCQIIGVKQFQDDDYSLFVKLDPSITYDQLKEKSHTIRIQLQNQINQSLASFIEGIRLHFLTGVYIISRGDRPKDTRQAVHNAYRYAYAVARRQLPMHFGCSREKLRNIIETENIDVLAQPIINLKNGDIFGWELLTRGPQNTLFHLPTELFDFAYQAELLTQVEFLVIKKALKKIAEIGIKESVFINITSVTLCHPLFLKHILEIMQQNDQVKTEQIIFEITEHHSIHDYEQVSIIVQKFRSHGFRFAVDDVGSGYASLQTISELIPDIIKIDKSVIQKIDQVSVKQSLLKTLLFFAENINCQVIAEGIETVQEAEVLFKHQVEMGQGYYFAHPEPVQRDNVHFERVRDKIMLRHRNVTA